MNMPIRFTPAVKSIAIACFAAFVVQQTVDQFFGGNFLGTFGLVPAAFINNFHVWQIFTFSFLHQDVIHLFFNLMMLVFIGSELEATWGTPRFVRFYAICTVAGGLAYLLLQLVAKGVGMYTPMVGASAGIYGLLAAYGLIFGERVMLFMMLFPMKAKHFVWILAGIEFLTSIFSGKGGLVSVAHLGGMAAGYAYLWGRATFVVLTKQKAISRDLAQRTKRVKGSKHLKLVKGKSEGQSDGSSQDGDGGGNQSGPRTWH
jgi:membrane associated rhomboid family serine protease